MHALRSALDLHSRGPTTEVEALPRQSSLGADLRLFAATFAAGFIFVSILIG
jgi:hypothetical protein